MKLQFKRGPQANLPVLDIGEPGLTTDQNRVYVGSTSGNIELARRSDLIPGPPGPPGTPGPPVDTTTAYKRLDELSISLVDFPKLAGETTDSPRIDRALSAINAAPGIRRSLILPEFVVIDTPILLKTYNKLKGIGVHDSQISLSASFVGSFAIGLASPDEGYVEIEGFTVAASNVTATVDGINLTNGYSTMVGEAHHKLRNLVVRDFTGSGVVLVGKGAVFVDSLSTLRVGNIGLDIQVWDSFFSNIDCGTSGVTGIKVYSGPNNLVNCKSWNTPIGYDITNDRHVLNGCFAQEIRDVAFMVRGKYNEISGGVDSVGYNYATSSRSATGYGVQFTSGANGNTVILSASNTKFNLVDTGSFQQLVQCAGFRNTVIASGGDWTTSVNSDVDDNTNRLFINGTVSSYVFSGGQTFRNSSLTNKNGVFIGGDSSRTNVGGVFASLNGTTNTHHGVAFDSADTSLMLCGNGLKPEFNNMSVGNSTTNFNNGYFKGFLKTGVFATASRPSVVAGDAGAMAFDSTLGKPIWWNGSVWKDATGTTV